VETALPRVCVRVKDGRADGSKELMYLGAKVFTTKQSVALLHCVIARLRGLGIMVPVIVV